MVCVVCVLIYSYKDNSQIGLGPVIWLNFILISFKGLSLNIAILWGTGNFVWCKNQHHQSKFLGNNHFTEAFLCPVVPNEIQLILQQWILSDFWIISQRSKIQLPKSLSFTFLPPSPTGNIHEERKLKKKTQKTKHIFWVLFDNIKWFHRRFDAQCIFSSKIAFACKGTMGLSHWWL